MKMILKNKENIKEKFKMYQFTEYSVNERQILCGKLQEE
jgi:hypothetical protein